MLNKTNHCLWPKQFIEEKLKDVSHGTHITLESKHLEGANLVAIRYRCNSKVTLYFVIIKNAGSKREEEPHEMKFVDSHSNIDARSAD